MANVTYDALYFDKDEDLLDSSDLFDTRREAIAAAKNWLRLFNDPTGYYVEIQERKVISTVRAASKVTNFTITKD